MDLTPEELAAQLAEYTRILESLKEQQGGLSEATIQNIAKIQNFVRELTTANQKLDTTTQKLKTALQAEDAGLDRDQARIQSLQLQIDQQSKLAGLYADNKKAIDDLAAASEKAAASARKADQQSTRAAAGANRSTTTATANLQNYAAESVKGVLGVGTVLKDLQARLQGLDAEQKVGIGLLALAGGFEKLKEGAIAAKRVPVTLDEATAAFNRNTLSVGNFAGEFIPALSNLDKFGEKYPELVDQLEASGGLFGRPGLMGAEAFQKALTEVITGTARFTGTLAKQNAGQTASLTSLVALLQESGIAGDETLGIFNSLNSGLDMNTSSAINFKKEIFNLGRSLGIGGRIFKNAGATLDNLQGFSDNVGESFKKLTVQATASGVSTERLIGIAGGLDTFESATKAAQGLNAIFGQGIFDPTEILETPVEDRLMMMKQRLDEAGLSFNDLGFRGKRAFASFLPGGASVAEVSRLMSESTAELTEKQLAQADATAITNDALADQVIAGRSSIEQLQKLLPAQALQADMSPAVAAVRSATAGITNVTSEIAAGTPELEAAGLDSVTARVTALVASMAGLSSTVESLRKGDFVEAAAKGSIIGFLTSDASIETAKELAKAFGFMKDEMLELQKIGGQPIEAKSPAPGVEATEVNEAKADQAKATALEVKPEVQVTVNHVTNLDGEVINKTVDKRTPQIIQQTKRAFNAEVPMIA